MPSFEIDVPGDKKYRVDGVNTPDEAWQQLFQQKYRGDPNLIGFDPDKSTGEQLTAAAKAFPGSAQRYATDTASALWSLISDPKAAGKAIYDMGWKGVASAIGDDLKKHYGSMDRAERTFEEDPARFAMDVLTVGLGGTAFLRKLAMTVAKTGRAAIPAIAGKMTDVGAEAFERAGQAGELGGTEAAQFRRGIADPGPLSRAPYRAAGREIGQAGWMPQKLTGPAAAGVLTELAGSGHLPSWASTVVGAGGVAGSSPRLMGETMYGLGRMQRGAQALPRTRTAIAAAAADMLKDQTAKKKLATTEIQTLRAASRVNADSLVLDKAYGILIRQLPTQVSSIEPSYGGTGGDQSNGGMRATAQTPSPGESSAPPQPRQEGGPVEPGKPYVVGEQGPEVIVPQERGTVIPNQWSQLPAPHGVPRVDISPPKQTTDDPLQKHWDMILAGDTPPANRNIPKAAQPGMETLDKFFGSFPGAKPRLEVVPPAPKPKETGGLEGLWNKLLKGGKELLGPSWIEQAEQLEKKYPTSTTKMFQPGEVEARTEFAMGLPGPEALTVTGKGARAAGELIKTWTGAQPHEIAPVSAAEFHPQLLKMKQTPHGLALDYPELETLGKMKTFAVPDKTAGYALDGDNITGVFKLPSSPLKNVGPALISSAVSKGGRRLDAYDTVLPGLYGDAGFRAVARVKFNPELAPNWNYEAFKKYNNGKPDLVVMVYDPYRPGYRPGDGKMVNTYAEAIALQKAEAANIGARMKAAEKKFDEIAQRVTGLTEIKQYLTPDEIEGITARNTRNLFEVFRAMPGEEMAAVAYSGRAKRGWYKQSAKALQEIFGMADAPRFVALLAAMSPRVSVERNTINALKTWAEWQRSNKNPEDLEGAVLAAMARALGGEIKSVMPSWRRNAIRALTSKDPLNLILSGPKVNSFYKNLAGNMHEVTNDAWMASYGGVDQGKFIGKESEDPLGYLGVKGPGYIGASAAARRAADILSRRTRDVWTPAEIQETVWSWAKTLKEKATSAEHRTTVEKLLRAGNISHAEIANTPDFATLFTQGIYRKILEESGYGKAVERLGGGTARGGVLPSGTPLRPEAGTFAEPAFRRHLFRAGRRLKAPEPEPEE